jgi:hypothetical protein
MDAEREKMLADAWARAEDEINQLRQQLATQKAYYESVFEDGAKRIRSLTENLDVAVRMLGNIIWKLERKVVVGSKFDGGVHCEFAKIDRNDAVIFEAREALAAIQSSEVTKCPE